MASPDDDLLHRLDKRLTIGEGLSLATDPPKRYFTKDQELLREARARIVQRAQDIQDWRVNRMADGTVHMLRCARVNGVWHCHAGCAVRRAERAEAKVAQMEQERDQLQAIEYWRSK